jgi:tetratricopeptide (TPR) repeat protein
MGAEQEIADLNSLVAGLYNQGKYRPALEIAKHAYEMAAQALGENHPLTLSSVNNAAALFKATHDYEKAEQLYLKALKIVANLYGEPHPESVFFLHNLARCYHAAGRYSEMEQILQNNLFLRLIPITSFNASTHWPMWRQSSADTWNQRSISRRL